VAYLSAPLPVTFSENGQISNFKWPVTLTLDRDILHTVVHHSSTSTYIPNFIEIEETFCGRTDVRMYIRTNGQTFETGFITSTLSKSQHKNSQVNIWCAKSCMCANETPYPIWIKFCSMVDVHDTITCAHFGHDRLRGLALAEAGQIFIFPVYFDHCPYNTHPLPCKCVIVISRTSA